MAIFYQPTTKPKKSAPKTASLHIQSLDHQGLGVAKQAGKVWFIENALPNEQVCVSNIDEKRDHITARATKWLETAPERQTPKCAHFMQCGGCQTQHIPREMLDEAKSRAFFGRLQQLQAEPIEIAPLLAGEAWGYRRRVRLSLLAQGKRVQLGFRQKASHQLVEIEECPVLSPRLSALLPVLRALFAQWQTPKSLGHIELVESDDTDFPVAMLLRVTQPLGETQTASLQQFSQQHRVSLALMHNENQLEQLTGSAPFYHLGENKLAFSIRDFIQVNRALNEQMVATACDWLALTPQDRVLDLFCGMGNFSLPLARRAGYVVGVEGVAEMVEKARANAADNGLTNLHFYQTDLAAPFADAPWAAEGFNKVLLDPARQGAAFALEHVCALAPERIVYVSCNPATFLRDAKTLRALGYRVERSALIDMFPQTSHVESITLFTPIR